MRSIVSLFRIAGPLLRSADVSSRIVTGARLTIVRPPDPLAKGHLDNSPVKVTYLIAVA